MPTFNTGREYSKEGQVIDYEVTSISEGEFGYLQYTIKFMDNTRCISGNVSFLKDPDDNTAASIQDSIIGQYDNGNY